MADDNKNGEGTGLKTFPNHVIDTSGGNWQTLAAVIVLKDVDEARERLEDMSIEQLREFRYDIDRVRGLIYNAQKVKMREADQAERQAHEAGLKSTVDQVSQ